MSAFMVSATHIDAMLTAGLESGPYGPMRWWVDDEPRTRENMRELTPETAGLTGAMLLAENRRSVNYRYQEDEWEDPYVFHRLSGYSHSQHAVMVLKAIHGFEYQACEHDDWIRSEARAFCVSLASLLTRRLPGYDEAGTWTIDDRHVFSQPIRH